MDRDQSEKSLTETSRNEHTKLSMSPPSMPMRLNEQILLGVQPDKRREGQQLWKIFKTGRQTAKQFTVTNECRFCQSELSRADLDDKELVRGKVVCRFCGRHVRKDLRAARLLVDERRAEEEGFFKIRRERLSEISELKRVARERAAELKEQGRDPLIRALSNLKRKARAKADEKATETYVDAVADGRVEHYEEEFVPPVPEEVVATPVKSTWLSRHLERVRKREEEEARKREEEEAKNQLREMMVADSYDTSQLDPSLLPDDGFDMYRDGDFDPTKRRGPNINRAAIRRTIMAIPMLQELSLTEEEIEALVDVAVVKQIKEGDKIVKSGEMMDVIVAGLKKEEPTPGENTLDEEGGEEEEWEEEGGEGEEGNFIPPSSPGGIRRRKKKKIAVFHEDEIFKGKRRKDSVVASKDETFVELSEGAILRLLQMGQDEDDDDGEEEGGSENDGDGDGDGSGSVRSPSNKPGKKPKLSSIVKKKRAAFLEMVMERRQESFIRKSQPNGSPIRHDPTNSPLHHGQAPLDRKNTNGRSFHEGSPKPKHEASGSGQAQTQAEGNEQRNGPFIIHSSSSRRLIQPKEVHQMKGRSGSQRTMWQPSFKLQAGAELENRGLPPELLSKGNEEGYHRQDPSTTAGNRDDVANGRMVVNPQPSGSGLGPAFQRSSSKHDLPSNIAPLISPRRHPESANNHPETAGEQTNPNQITTRMYVSHVSHHMKETAENEGEGEGEFKTMFERPKKMKPPPPAPKMQKPLKSTSKSPPPRFRAMNLLDEWNASLPYLQPFRGDFDKARKIALLGKERQFQRFEVQQAIHRWSIDVPPSQQSFDEDSSSLSLSDEDGGDSDGDLSMYLPSLSRAVGAAAAAGPRWSPETGKRAVLAATPTKYMRLHRDRQPRGQNLVGRAVHSSLEFYRPDEREREGVLKEPSLERSQSAAAEERALAMELLWLARKRAEESKTALAAGADDRLGSPSQLGVYGASGQGSVLIRRARTTRTGQNQRTSRNRGQRTPTIQSLQAVVVPDRSQSSV